ncbi:MAG TPA: hypothetical protein DHV12_01650 [Thermotogae bacterium]|nr:hypothetical protein [Thermotogota bacterium]
MPALELKPVMPWQVLGCYAIKSLSEISGKFSVKVEDGKLLVNASPKDLAIWLLENMIEDGRPRLNTAPFLSQYRGNYGKLLNSFGKKNKSSVCTLCGKEGAAVELSKVFNPLMVSAPNFKTFYSFGKNRGEKLCVECALQLFAAPLGAFFFAAFQKHTSRIIHLYTFPWNLDEAFVFIDTSKRTVGNEVRKSNITLNMKKEPVHPEEALLMLLWQLRKNSIPFENETFVAGAVSHTKQGQAWGVETRLEIYKLRPLVRFFEALIEEGLDLSLCFDMIYEPRLNDPHAYRKRIAADMVRMVDVARQAEDVLLSIDRHIPFLSDIVGKYEMEVKGMDEKLVELCKDVGRSIGRFVFTEESKLSTFYQIRNAKTLEDYIRVLEEVSLDAVAIESELYLPEDYLKLLSSNDWEIVRSLTNIFAVSMYRYLKSGKKEVNSNE